MIRILIALGAAGISATAIYLSLSRASSVKPRQENSNLPQSSVQAEDKNRFFNPTGYSPKDSKKSQIMRPEISLGCMS